jgi:hypothetical protein
MAEMLDPTLGTGEIDGQGGEVARREVPKAPCSTARSAKRMA